MRTIAICGFDPASRDMANSQPENVERWVINNFGTFLKGKPDRVYQIHPKDWKANQGVAAGTYGRGNGYVETLAEVECSVFMQAPDDRVPDAKIFPAQEIIDHFGRRYFTSSPAWMVAHALMEHDKAKRDKLKEIRMFGITLSTTHEYFIQRPCLEWMIGHAEARGIKFDVPNMSTLMKGPLYPYAELGGDMQNLRQMAQERVNTWRKQSMDERDKAMTSTAVASSLDNILTAIEESEGKPIDLLGAQKMMKNTAQQYLNMGNSSHASFREAQDSLIRLGGGDLPPTDTPVLDVGMADAAGKFPIRYGELDESAGEPAVEATVEEEPQGEVAD